MPLGGAIGSLLGEGKAPRNRFDRLRRAKKTGDVEALENFDTGSGFGGAIAEVVRRSLLGQAKRGGLPVQKEAEKKAAQRGKAKRRRRSRSLISSDDSNVRRKTLLGS